MEFLQMKQWSSPRLQQVSLQLEEGETMILLGDQCCGEVFQGIIGRIHGKQGEITWNQGIKRPKTAIPVVYGDCFLPLGVKPLELYRIFASFMEKQVQSSYQDYLSALNVSMTLPLQNLQQSYKTAVALSLCEDFPIFLLETPNLVEKEDVSLWKTTLTDCFRVIQREKRSKILHFYDYDQYETWGVSADSITIFHKGIGILSGKIPELEENIGKINCNLEESLQIPSGQVIWKKVRGNTLELLLKSGEEFRENHQEMKVEQMDIRAICQFIQVNEDDS